MNNKHKPVVIWLLTGCLLIALMVVIGGITRLTQSGLSMVDWKPIMGTLPPLTAEEWNQTFRQYQLSPEFKLKNYHFSLEEFKSIFWWEYIHRLLGRFIGLVFFIPFLIFVVQRRISGTLTLKSLIILLLGGLQGLLGWYMVKSGLVKDPHVSHYRLAAHLFTAFVTFCYTLWVALGLMHSEKSLKPQPRLKKWSIGLLAVTALQIIFGAFVAGLKAGKVYNTFPKMGDKWIADSVSFAYQKSGLISLVENLASVQFVHRYLGLAIGLLTVVMFTDLRKKSPVSILTKGPYIFTQLVLFQIILGIFTLIFAVPVWLGVLHQLGALLLLTSLVYNLFIGVGNKR